MIEFEHYKIHNNDIFLSNKVRKKVFAWSLSYYKKYQAGNRTKDTRILNTYYGKMAEIAFRLKFNEGFSKIDRSEIVDPGYDFVHTNGATINVKSINASYKQFVTFNENYDTKCKYYSLLYVNGEKYIDDLKHSILNLHDEKWTYIGTVSRKTMLENKKYKQEFNHPFVYKNLFENSNLTYEDIINNRGWE